MPNMLYWTYTAFMIHIFLTKNYGATSFFLDFPNVCIFHCLRETTPVLTSDNVKKSVLVLAHLFVPP